MIPVLLIALCWTMGGGYRDGRVYVVPGIYLSWIGPMLENPPAWSRDVAVTVRDALTDSPISDAVVQVIGTTHQVALFLPVHVMPRLDYETILHTDSQGQTELTREQMNSSQVRIAIWAPRYGPATLGYRDGKFQPGVSLRWETGPIESPGSRARIRTQTPGIFITFLPNSLDSSTPEIRLYGVDWDTRVWAKAIMEKRELTWELIEEDVVNVLIELEEADWRRAGGNGNVQDWWH